MTTTEARRALTEAISAIEVEPAVANYLVRGSGILDGVPARIDFESEVAAEVRDDVLGFARGIADRELIEYDPSFQPSSGQALVDDLAESPGLERIDSLLAAGSPLLDSGAGEPVGAIAHRVDAPGGAAITAYRLTGPGIATKRASGIRILVPRDGIYVRVPEEIVYYQPRFDALVVGGFVIVTAPTTLQRKLGSDARAKKIAKETFKAATMRIDIEGLTDLADAVSSDPAMIAKMMRLSRTLEADPDYADSLTTPRLLEFLDANPQIDIAIAGEGSARHLVFESSPQKRYLIPKALADDFLRSELTSRRYEAGSKQRLPD